MTVLLTVLQVAIWYYGQSVATAAAQHGLDAARVPVGLVRRGRGDRRAVRRPGRRARPHRRRGRPHDRAGVDHGRGRGADPRAVLLGPGERHPRRPRRTDRRMTAPPRGRDDGGSAIAELVILIVVFFGFIAAVVFAGRMTTGRARIEAAARSAAAHDQHRPRPRGGRALGPEPRPRTWRPRGRPICRTWTSRRASTAVAEPDVVIVDITCVADLSELSLIGPCPATAQLHRLGRRGARRLPGGRRDAPMPSRAEATPGSCRRGPSPSRWRAGPWSASSSTAGERSASAARRSGQRRPRPARGCRRSTSGRRCWASWRSTSQAASRAPKPTWRTVASRRT